MREQSVFIEVLEKDDPAERTVLLDRLCTGDPALRQRIERLLERHQQADSLLDSPAAALSPTVDEGRLSEGPSSEIGPYKLLEQIGEGGFGVVFMAEQSKPIQRKVALKIIKPGMDTQQVIARFEAERQALALMDHPNIAKVLDAGTTANGRPYFVMELVRGVPVTNYCDEKTLAIRQRLALFVTICQAVQHAHQKGIIHRDIKPTNVLVTQQDGRPLTKVIDFGVAKATGQKLTEKTLFTGFAQLIGTPLYMSPEQAELSAQDVDTRSDIYSLGVLLYELLTGTTPFDKDRLKSATFDELRRIIREEEPPRPSTRLSTLAQQTISTVATHRGSEPRQLSRLFRGELDWIVMKCLEKNRTRRYDTASALASDVDRYLADEPVEACPPSAAYRLRKFTRRHRGAVIAASLVLLSLVAGVIGTTLEMLEANRAKVREAQRADGEQKAKLEAERNLAFARKGNEILGSVFAGLDPKRIAESGRPLQDVLRDNLTKAVKELEGSAIGDPLEVAAMQSILGWSLLGLGEYELAVQVFEKAQQTHQAKLGGDHPATLATMHNLACGYLAAGKLDLALPLFEKTFKLRKTKFGRDHPDTLVTMNYLANGYSDAGKLDLALPLWKETLELRKAKLGPDHPDTLMSMDNLARGYLAAGQFDLALSLFEETLKLRKAKLSPDHPNTLISMNNLAAGYRTAGKLDLALPLFEEVLRLQKAKLGPDHPETLNSMNNLATSYEAAGQLDRALPLIEETLRLQKAKLGPDHPLTLMSMNNLARGYLAAGKLDLALSLFEETLKLRKAKLGPDHPNTLISINNLAVGYRTAGKLDLALPLFEEVLRLQKAKLGPDHPDTLTSMNNLATSYEAAGQLDRALPLIEETLRLRKAKLSPDHPDTLNSMNSLGSGYLAAGKLDLALSLFEETLKLRKAKLGPDHPDTLTSMKNLAAGYLAAGKLDAALPLMEETLKLCKAKLGSDHQLTLTNMHNLGAAYSKVKRLDQAIPLLELTLQLQEKNLGRQHPDTLFTLVDLGVCYNIAGRPQDGIPLLEEAYRASRKYRSLSGVGPKLCSAYMNAGESTKLINLLEEQLPEARKTLPKDSLELANSLVQLGWGLMEQGRWSEAEPLLREGLTIREKTQPDAWTTFNARSYLGRSLLGQKRYADAEPLLLSGYEGMKQREKTIPPEGITKIPEAVDRLIELYTATNKPDEVKKWQVERAKYPAAKK